jgi:hypothetical protein
LVDIQLVDVQFQASCDVFAWQEAAILAVNP